MQRNSWTLLSWQDHTPILLRWWVSDTHRYTEQFDTNEPTWCWCLRERGCWTSRARLARWKQQVNLLTPPGSRTQKHRLARIFRSNTSTVGKVNPHILLPLDGVCAARAITRSSQVLTSWLGKDPQTKRDVHWSGYLRAGLLVGADVPWWVLGTAGLSEHSHCYWHWGLGLDLD